MVCSLNFHNFDPETELLTDHYTDLVWHSLDFSNPKPLQWKFFCGVTQIMVKAKPPHLQEANFNWVHLILTEAANSLVGWCPEIEHVEHPQGKWYKGTSSTWKEQ